MLLAGMFVNLLDLTDERQARDELALALLARKATAPVETAPARSDALNRS